ncbi:MAG: hypothetical protein ACE5K1_03620 [Acidiferrobacterales bacterium]
MRRPVITAITTAFQRAYEAINMKMWGGRIALCAVMVFLPMAGCLLVPLMAHEKRRSVARD